MDLIDEFKWRDVSWLASDHALGDVLRDVLLFLPLDPYDRLLDFLRFFVSQPRFFGDALQLCELRFEYFEFSVESRGFFRCAFTVLHGSHEVADLLEMRVFLGKIFLLGYFQLSDTRFQAGVLMSEKHFLTLSCLTSFVSSL